MARRRRRRRRRLIFKGEAAEERLGLFRSSSPLDDLLVIFETTRIWVEPLRFGRRGDGQTPLHETPCLGLEAQSRSRRPSTSPKEEIDLASG